MQMLTFILALLALVIAVLAYIRSGGVADLRRQMSSLGSTSETFRSKTADALSRLEGAIRGKQPPSSAPASSEKPQDKPPAS